MLIATNIMKHSPASQAPQNELQTSQNGLQAPQATPQHGLHHESSQQQQHEQQQPPQKFTRRIGKNYYEVVVHFSNTSKENISDKVTRLIRNEVLNETAVKS